jgi:Protein of unknown function (DUF2877)
MKVAAAFSTAVRPVLTGPVQPVEWLGASASALYLITGPGTVVAVVADDAVRLPCAVVLASTAAELPLTELAPGPGRGLMAPASVGDGRVEWTGPNGTVTVVGVREWAPRVVGFGHPLPAALDVLSAAVIGHDIGVEADRVALLANAGEDPAAQFAAVARLLGRGPGLTPSGDDVVAGFLLGAYAFGHAVPGAVTAVGELTERATTALSAQLLRHAVHGECIAQVAALVAALTRCPAPGDAVDQLLAVGHTSGAALAAGLLSAAAPAVTAAKGGVG